MPTRHKITKQVENTIIAIAATLPTLRRTAKGVPMSRTLTKRVLGKDLPKEYKNKNDWHPTRWYTYKYSEPVFVNHVVNLRESYVRDGDLGLTHYINALGNYVIDHPDKKPVLKFTFWGSVKNWVRRKLLKF